MWTVLCKTFRMHKTRIQPNFLFYGHGYMQHGGLEWSSKNFLRYPTNLIPESYVFGETRYTFLMAIHSGHV